MSRTINHWLWLRGLLFILAIWGAWAILDRPILMATRRPSSVDDVAATLPIEIKNCVDRAAAQFPDLGSGLAAPKSGVFEDSKSFARKLRVVWSPSEAVWKLQQFSETGINDWRTVAKFWDVDGDSYPDEALLLIDPSKLGQWNKSEDASQWSFFTHLEKDGNSWAWLARLDRQDWSAESNCYAWANPVVAFVNWATMQHRWSPSMALAGDELNKAPASVSR